MAEIFSLVEFKLCFGLQMLKTVCLRGHMLCKTGLRRPVNSKVVLFKLSQTLVQNELYPFFHYVLLNLMLVQSIRTLELSGHLGIYLAFYRCRKSKQIHWAHSCFLCIKVAFCWKQNVLRIECGYPRIPYIRAWLESAPPPGHVSR